MVKRRKRMTAERLEKVGRAALGRYAEEAIKHGSPAELQSLLQWVHAEQHAEECERERNASLPEMPSWSTKKRQALEGFVSGMTASQISRTYGISQTAIQKYKADDDFVGIIQTIERRRLEYIDQRRTELAVRSMEAIDQVLTDPHASHSDRLRAAKMGIDLAGLTVHRHEVSHEVKHSPEYERAYEDYERAYDAGDVTDAEVIAAIEGESEVIQESS